LDKGNALQTQEKKNKKSIKTERVTCFLFVLYPPLSDQKGEGEHASKIMSKNKKNKKINKMNKKKGK